MDNIKDLIEESRKDIESQLHLQAITNGYAMSQSLNGHAIQVGFKINPQGVIEDARKFATALFEDYKEVIKDKQIATKAP